MKNVIPLTLLLLYTLILCASQAPPLTEHQKMLNDLWNKHLSHEFNPSEKSTKATMDTMVHRPYVNHVPTLTGGVGKKELYYFYQNHFIFQNPYIEMIPISRTIGNDHIVDESVAKFTHTVRIDSLLPGIEPTGKEFEFPMVVIVRFEQENGVWRVAHEHVYWDQATVLVQAGLIDGKKLPVSGKEQASKVKDPDSVKSNLLMGKDWKYGEKEEL